MRKNIPSPKRQKFVAILSPFLWVLFTAGIFIGCENPPQEVEVVRDPLPSWNEGPNKMSIIDFIGRVTDSKSEEFVPVSERIAVFDNDGTLWAEKPMYFQLFFAMDQVKKMLPEHPEWEENPVFRAVLNDDIDSLKSYGIPGLLELVMATHSGICEEEFNVIVKNWMAAARHPEKNLAYTDLVYQPMLELIDYLKSKQFKVYIVSGGGLSFIRAFSEAVYKIPPEQVIGSSLKSVYQMDEDPDHIIREAGIEFINDKEGKPVSINRVIGRKPIFAAGNSDGDLEMLLWTSTQDRAFFNLLIQHTDAEREWAYDLNSSVGHLEHGLKVAKEKSWTVVDMKQDWKTVFPSPSTE